MLSVGDDAYIVPLVCPSGGFLLMKIYEGSHAVRRGRCPHNVINLKRPLNGKQNVWKYQNGEEKSDSDGREKDV